MHLGKIFDYTSVNFFLVRHAIKVRQKCNTHNCFLCIWLGYLKSPYIYAMYSFRSLFLVHFIVFIKCLRYFLSSSKKIQHAYNFWRITTSNICHLGFHRRRVFHHHVTNEFASLMNITGEAQCIQICCNGKTCCLLSWNKWLEW